MKKNLYSFLLIFLVLSCSKESFNDSIDTTNTDPEVYTIAEVNEYLDQILRQNGDIDWMKTEPKLLYSAIWHGGKVLSIGYGPKNKSFSTEEKTPDIQKALNSIKTILTENATEKTDVTIQEDAILLHLETDIQNMKTVEELQSSKDVRFLDPIGYNHFTKNQNPYAQKNAGCGEQEEDLNPEDYTAISPGALQPWNYTAHNIPQAWQLSTGAGVTVGIIDTGLTPKQELLNEKINDGISENRSVERYGTYIDSPWWWSDNIDGPDDRCGHGTQMAAVLASPRNDEGLPVGVAYNANLVVYRGTADVLLNDYHERKGVVEALKQLADRSDVKIISMSIGYVWSIGSIKDAVRYAYSKDKLIIAAGGTSTSFTNWYGIIFPASMRETVAVTGIKDNGYNRCDICHDGDMDFSIIMQRAQDAKRNVPILGFNTGTTQYSSGSSVATAITSGIAALVWAQNPNLSRDEVLDKLKRSGEFYPNRDPRFGYGNIDALKAVQ